MKKTILLFALVCATFAFAEDPSSARWSVRAGYAWRARARTDFSSSARSASPGGIYENGSVDGAGNWTGGDFAKLPSGIGPGSAGDGNDWALVLSRGEASGSGSDEAGMQGLDLAASWRFAEAQDIVDVALQLRFAAYWNLGNASSGGYARYNDYARFVTPVSGATPDPGLDYAESPAASDRRYLAGGSRQTMRLEADLYQIGIGPTVSVEAFRWCRPLSWINVYAGVEALCNVIDSEFDAGGASADETNCRLGFGGHVGLMGNLTRNMSVFAQAGYEWIDEDNVSVRGVRATTDYSSLVLSAGLVFRF